MGIGVGVGCFLRLSGVATWEQLCISSDIGRVGTPCVNDIGIGKADTNYFLCVDGVAESSAQLLQAAFPHATRYVEGVVDGWISSQLSRGL